MNTKSLLYLILFFQFFPAITQSQEIFPTKNWQTISNPEELGWSINKLDEAKAIADEIGSDAVFIVYKGAVLKAWGAIERKFMCHSMRKSMMSALIGLYVDEGIIDIDHSLADLNIVDSMHQLTATEKTATIEDLLSSRSGIYLPAAYEFPSRKPQRGKFKPGENWYYANNWDYNVLGTIYEQESGKKIFEDFHKRFAIPLQMNDYEISDGYYHYELNKSAHSAYPFRMSARDLARFGLLFLRKGKWGNHQVLSKSWVEKSTSPISQTYSEGEGYGYLWWVDQKNFQYSYFSAEGAGGHGIIVVPDLDVVIVHRVNTFIDKDISYRQRGRLIASIMDAKIDNPTHSTIKLGRPSSPQLSSPYTFIELDNQAQFAGIYNMEQLLDYESNQITIQLDQSNELNAFIPYKGHFKIYPISETLFMLEDSNELLTFLQDGKGNPNRIIYHRNSRFGKK